MGKPKGSRKKKKSDGATKKPKVLSRKEKRKEHRKAVKVTKQQHYLSKFGKVVAEPPKPEPTPKKKSVKFNDDAKKPNDEAKKKSKESKFKKAQEKQRKLQLKEANYAEDKVGNLL